MACLDHGLPEGVCPGAGPSWAQSPWGLEQEWVPLSGSLPFSLGVPSKAGDLSEGGWDGRTSRLRKFWVSQRPKDLTTHHPSRVALSAGPPREESRGQGTNLGNPGLPCPQWGQSWRRLTSMASSSNTRI